MKQLIIKFTPNFDSIVYTEVYTKKNDECRLSPYAQQLQKIIKKQEKDMQDKHKPSHLVAHF